MNSGGKKFQSISNKQVKVLEEAADPVQFLTAQLPVGASLDDMIGACPGAPGEVRLTYFPEKRLKSKKQTTQWRKMQRSGCRRSPAHEQRLACHWRGRMGMRRHIHQLQPDVRLSSPGPTQPSSSCSALSAAS